MASQPLTHPSTDPHDRFELIGDPAVAGVARRIAAYWLSKPEACDTAKGIREWWLSDPVADHLVRQALHELGTLGVATQDASGSGQEARYRLAVPPDALRLWLAPSAGQLGPDGRPLPH